MADLEKDTRHNPSRTQIPKRFVDLGRLFDEDSRSEYMHFSQAGEAHKDGASQINGIDETMGAGDTSVDNDFIIGKEGITDISTIQ